MSDFSEVNLVDEKYEEENVYLALYKNDLVIAILEDQEPTPNEQKNLISIVGGELVLLHGVVTFTLIEELRKTHYSPNQALDSGSTNLLKNPSVFGRDVPNRFNTPFKVEFIPGIEMKWSKGQEVTAVWLDRRGYPADMSPKLSTREQIVLAKISRFTHLLGIFEITHELNGMASIHRSTSK